VTIKNAEGQIISPSKWRTNKNGKAPYQGKFYPANPKKYVGNVDNIIFRSGMELRLFKHLDLRQNVLEWSSEELAIPYVSPLDNKIHRYFPDALVKSQYPDGTTKVFLFEIKESTQLNPPKPPKTKKGEKRFIREMKTYKINDSKWKAARQVCAKNGWEFQFLTEKDLR
jgi:hypothetical protein